MSDNTSESEGESSDTDAEELTDIVAEVYALADVDESLADRTRIQPDGEKVYIPPTAIRQITDRIAELEGDA